MMRKNNNNKNNYNKNRQGGGGGRRYHGGSGGHSNGNRTSNDSGNIARQKHHATQQREKYSNMARDAQINGDRVDVEYYLQHVDHYTRVLTDIGAIEAERYAHQREQQSQQASDQGSNESQPVQPTDANETSQANSEAPADFAANQPRMTRQRYPRTEQIADDNGAAAANSNTADIPLPDNILPII